MLMFLKVFRPLAVDFLSTIVFIVVYEITNNIIIAASVGIGIGIAQLAFARFRGQKFDAMQWASLGLVVVLGGATLVTRDPRFVMIKPSIGAFAIGCVMLQRGWQNRYFPPAVKEHVSPRTLVIWGYVWAAMYFALSAANLFVAYRLGLKTWAWFTAFVPTSAMLGLFVIQYVSLRAAVFRNIRAKAAETQNVAMPLIHENRAMDGA